MTTLEKIKKSFEMSEKEKEVLRLIGFYYHNNCENLEKAFEQLKNLSIHKVLIKNRTIYICLEHPGLFIGERGLNISAIETYLHGKSFKEFKLRVVEVTQPALNFLTSWTYMYRYIDEI